MLLTLVSAVVAAWLVIRPGGGDAPDAAPSPEQSPPPASVSGGAGVDGEFLFNYYDQDGDHSPVTGGLGTEALQVLSPVVVAQWISMEYYFSVGFVLTSFLGIYV